MTFTVTYNNGHTAIHNASFNLSGGAICALVGVNGSGKSTLFKSIMGLVKPTTGRVQLNDKPVAQALKKNIIAYVPQTEDVDWNFPVLVEDVVMMGRYGKMNFLRIPSREDRLRVDKALERVGLSELRTRQIGELSGGRKNGCSWRGRWRNKVPYCCWMNPSPAWTSKPRTQLSICCARCVTRAT
ncbi:Energy-coupling factor transporter ATP-binding protein EcfA 1 [Serratia plymuthica]|uniref:Energy-coupling factor transporter ATP-binding protein EcfA 1 n=1 Tax=Serratia plymuthica TaxID=82996 RepID=A0A2X4XEX7_SERPL|nr:Energy-coupling factor transporter ATP-binding protein EcfA 1 [Serratia plymuthica]